MFNAYQLSHLDEKVKMYSVVSLLLHRLYNYKLGTFEQQVGEWLESHNIPFKSETTLRSGAKWAAKSRKAGHTAAVPDFFFPAVVSINVVRVSWLDAKNYATLTKLLEGFFLIRRGWCGRPGSIPGHV